MLELTRKTSGHLNIRFVQGASSDLGPQLGRFQAVTIGRAFHWMERTASVLADLFLMLPAFVVFLAGISVCPAPH